MARRKHIKRIDPRYFLHETVNRGTDLVEGCPSEEEGEAIDISGPGVELHVDDIDDLPPDEAFAAGLAAARDAIDQILGDSDEDLPEEEIIALAEQLVLRKLALLREENEKEPSKWQMTGPGTGTPGSSIPWPMRRANIDALQAKQDEYWGGGGMQDLGAPAGRLRDLPKYASMAARAALGQDVSDEIADIELAEPNIPDVELRKGWGSLRDMEAPEAFQKFYGKDWKKGKLTGPPKRPGGETSPVDWDRGGESPVDWADDTEEVVIQRSHPGSRGVADDIDWSEQTLYSSPNIQGVPDDMQIVPAPDNTWAVIPKRLQEAIDLLRMNELAGVPKKLQEDRGDHIQGINDKIGRLEAEIERAEDSLEEAERLVTDPSSEELTFQNLMDLRTRPQYYETQLRISKMRETVGLLGQQLAQLEEEEPGQLARPEY